MTLQNREHLRQSIKKNLFKDEAGFANSCVGLFIMLFFVVMLIFVIDIAAYKSLSDKMEDALAASGLAACVIDIKRYGKDHSVVIADPGDAFEKYKETLEINMNLLGNIPGADSFIDGPVKIDTFRVYNCEGSKVTEYVYNDEVYVGENVGTLGNVKAPNGQLVTETGVYSEISFPVDKGILMIGGGEYDENNRLIAKKNKLTFVRKKS